MGDFQDILILLSFLLEVAVLFYLEFKAWKTLYTPLIFLMLPYTIVLLISIAISGNFGFIDFYYPSILIWNAGILIFALPSFSLAYLLHKNNIPSYSTIQETTIPKSIWYIAILIILLFAWRFKSMHVSMDMIGSHDFGEEFSGRGLWGHLRQLSMPILIMAIYFVDKNKKWLWLLIIPLFIVALLYQVLGWVIIPCLAGIAIRLYTGKTKLRISLFLYVILGVSIVFMGSYIMSLVIAGDSELDNEVISFIFRNFFHYLTSGTLGFSIDMELGCPDAGEFDFLITQLINLVKTVVGNNDFQTTINPLFYNTGVNLTNVRTLFGSVYLHSDFLTFIVYVFILSCIMYSFKLMTIRYNNIYVYVAYFFECGLLFMGWFDTYFASLSSLEIPILSLLLLLIDTVLRPRQKNVIEECTQNELKI